jgi:hypothetical protein
MGEFDKITERAVARIHAVVVGHVVPVVAAGETWNGISQSAVIPRCK